MKILLTMMEIRIVEFNVPESDEGALKVSTKRVTYTDKLSFSADNRMSVHEQKRRFLLKYFLFKFSLFFVALSAEDVEDRYLPPATAKSNVDRPHLSVLQYQLVPAADLAESREISSVATAGARSRRPRPIGVVVVGVKSFSAAVQTSNGVAQCCHVAVATIAKIVVSLDHQTPEFVVVDRADSNARRRHGDCHLLSSSSTCNSVQSSLLTYCH